MKDKLLKIGIPLILVLAGIALIRYFSVPLSENADGMKSIEILDGREYTGYDIKDGVKMSWKVVDGAQKYNVIKNGETVQTITADKNSEVYTFTESDMVFDNAIYAVNASKNVRQKQYYNKETKEWQTSEPAVENRGRTRYRIAEEVFAASDAMPIKLNSGSNGEGGAAHNIRYYTDTDSNITGYKSFDIADTHYIDISNNKDVSVNTDYWKYFVSSSITPGGNSLLKEWATIGESICSQYTGYKTYWGSWKNDYHGGDNRLNYISDMSTTVEKTWGSRSRDNSKTSGLLTAKSFSEVREKMSDEIQDRIDHNALDKESSKILSNSKLSVLNNDTPRDIIYVVGTNICEVSDYSYVNKYKYSAHVIMFYDFALEPVIDNNLEKISDIRKYQTLEEAAKNSDKVVLSDTDKVVYTDNDNISSTTMSVTSGMTYSNALSATMTNTEQISFGESLSLQGGLDFKISDFISAKTSVTTTFTWGQAYTSAMSNGSTVTESSTNQQSVTMTVPPQSSLGVREQISDLTCKYNFKTPMRVTYKVCIADIVGMVYADDGVVCDFESYDQGSFAVFFGEGGNNGTDATNSLYLRADENLGNKEYDNAYGKVYTCSSKNEKYNEGIDWAKASSAAKTSIRNLIYNQPIISNGGTINVTSKVAKFSVGKPIPLYRLSAIGVNKSKIDADQEVIAAVGDNYVINNRIQLLGFNENGMTYSLFVQGKGRWIACDEEGKEINAADNELFEITSMNILKAKKAGNGFITYRLSDEAKNQYISKEGGSTVNPGDPHGNNDTVCAMPIIAVKIQ